MLAEYGQSSEKSPRPISSRKPDGAPVRAVPCRHDACRRPSRVSRVLSEQTTELWSSSPDLKRPTQATPVASMVCALPPGGGKGRRPSQLIWSDNALERLRLGSSGAVRGWRWRIKRRPSHGAPHPHGHGQHADGDQAAGQTDPPTLGLAPSPSGWPRHPRATPLCGRQTVGRAMIIGVGHGDLLGLRRWGTAAAADQLGSSRVNRSASSS
jgi:hypothetical protein